MITSTTVEKTTTYKLTKAQIIDILLKEAGVEPADGRTVIVKFECTGGEDPYGKNAWTPMDVTSATITVIEKS